MLFCTVSAFSLVQGCNTFFFCATNDCCLLVSRTLRVCRTLPVSLSLSSPTCSCWCASFSAQRCCREWVSFSAQFWTYGIRNFFFCSFLFLCDCRVNSRLVIMTHPLTLPVLFLCGFFSWWRCRSQECANIVIQVSMLLRVLRTVAHLVLLVSSISVHGSGREICLLVHNGLCVKTLHLGTVSVCLTWSSLLPRYCCLVDCHCCDLKMYHIFCKNGNWRSVGIEIRGIPYHWCGATVQSVSRLLVVKRAIPLFHVGMKKLQRWKHLNSE